MAKGIEVLLLDDPVDEFWLQEVKGFQNHDLRSLTRGDIDLSEIKGDAEAARAEEALGDMELKRLIARLKASLGEEVADVRLSKRLRDSAVCLVAEDHGMDLRLERFLKQHSQIDKLSKRVLEINGQHELTRRMAAMAVDEAGGVQFDELAGCCSTRPASSRASRSPTPARSRGGCRASWRRGWRLSPDYRRFRACSLGCSSIPRTGWGRRSWSGGRRP